MSQKQQQKSYPKKHKQQLNSSEKHKTSKFYNNMIMDPQMAPNKIVFQGQDMKSINQSSQQLNADPSNQSLERIAQLIQNSEKIASKLSNINKGMPSNENSAQSAMGGQVKSTSINVGIQNPQIYNTTGNNSNASKKRYTSNPKKIKNGINKKSSNIADLQQSISGDTGLHDRITSSSKQASGGSNILRTSANFKNQAKPNMKNSMQQQHHLLSLQHLQLQSQIASQSQLFIKDGQHVMINRPGQPNQFSGNLTTTNAAIRDSRSAGPVKQGQNTNKNFPQQNMVTLQPDQLQHLQQLRQNSIQSQQSQNSQGSGLRQQQDPQFRRRFVAPQEATQTLGSGRFNSRKKNDVQQDIQSSLERGPYAQNQAHPQGDGVKIISKKLINFRPQSNGVEKKQNDTSGELQIQEQQNVQELSQQRNADKQSFYVSPSSGKQKQNLLNPSVQNQLSPRKQGTETYGQGAIGGTPSQRANSSSKPGQNKAMRGKAPRLISGHPGRRLAQDQNTIQVQKDPNNQYTTTVTQSQQKSESLQPTQGSNSLNWRRQPQTQASGESQNVYSAFDSNQKNTTKGRNLNGVGKNNLSGNRQNSKNPLQTLPMSTLDSHLISENQDAFLPQNSVQVDQGKAINTKSDQNLNSAASLNLDKSKKSDQQNMNVIFHPHPLNNNIAQSQINGIDLNSLGSQRAAISQIPSEQATIESARPISNKLQMNNRNSRKNLRPLANKQQKQQTGQYTAQQRQFAPYNTAQISQGNNSNTNLNLNRQFIQTDGSVTRENGKTLATGAGNNLAQSSFYIGPQQMTTPSENYQVTQKGTNVTNKNALFKFKKNSQTNRAGYQSQGIDHTQSANSTGRRPIVIRKNNFITQQQPMNQNQNQGGSLNRQIMQQMQQQQQLANKYVNKAQKQIKPNKTQVAQSSSQGKDRKLYGMQGQYNSNTNVLQQPQTTKGFKPSQTMAFGGVGQLSTEEEIILESGKDSIKSQFKNLPVTLTRQDESKELISNSIQQPHTARIAQAATDSLNPRHSDSTKKNDLHQTTMLGSLTHNNISKGNQYQSSVGELQTTSLINLQGGPKLIKVNKSKKMLDTARRSRIQQLDNKDASQASQNQITALNLVKMNSNGAPQNQVQSAFVGQGGQPQINTTKATHNNQLQVMQPPSKNVRKPQQQPQKKFGALIQSQQQPNILRQSLENEALQGQNSHQKQLQLKTNINIQADHQTKQAHTQKNQNQKLISKGNSTVDQNDIHVQVKTARVSSEQKNEISQQSNQERASKVGDSTGSKPLRRGQIFKKQMKNSETNSIEKLQTINNLTAVQSIPNLQVIKTINETKQGDVMNVQEGLNKFDHKQNPAVKIENQLSLNLSGEIPTEGTPEEQQRIIAKFSDLQQNTQEMTPILKDSQESKIEKQQISILNEISEEGLIEDLQNGDNYQTQQITLNAPVQKVLKLANKVTDQRVTAADTNSNRKQTTDSMQRTNINNSMQNVPRGVINTAFSLSSIASRDEVPPLPTSPQNILRYYIHELTDYEKGEILDYDTIYFLGNDRSKKVDGKNQANDKKDSTQEIDRDISGESSSQQKEGKEKDKKEEFNHNYGYDDDKGDYKIVTGDHIGYRYEIKEFLGKGSFGTALSVYDHKEKRLLAIKIVKNKKKYYYQASVELKILQYLRQHDTEDIMNVIHIEDYVVFRKHLCMAFELLSMNLFEFLKINDFNGFDHNLIRRFAIQLLYALKYLKQLEIIHCDLKPENILLKEENKSGIKIIDFGSSTFIDEKVYTYIQSRFYRAPEIMLGIPYTPAIDMWSLGCIMAELYIGYPLFPGESENDQMSRVMEMRDAPPGDVLQVSERKMKFFTVNKDTRVLEPIMLKNSRGKLRKPNGKPLDYVMGDEDPDFNDFVSKCLDWNPETRLTPDEALKHVWVLKGLPPQVLIHHQKMHNISTPELPPSVKEARDEFIEEQQREQEYINQQTLRKSREKQGRTLQKNPEAGREISLNPNAGRPQIHLKTPRAAQGNPQQFQRNLNTDSGESKGNSYDRPQTMNTSSANVSGYPGTTKNSNQAAITSAKINFAQTTKLSNKKQDPDSNQAQQPQGNGRRKFVIKKINKGDQQ